MRQEILNLENKRWLKDNFQNLDDIAICAYLSAEQCKANAREVKRLEGLLYSLNKKDRRRVQGRINRLKAFKEISVNTMRNNAKRLGCGHKKGVHISNLRRMAARKRHTDNWERMAEDVTDLTKWLRSFGKNETKVIRLGDSRNERTIRQTASRMNKIEGPKTNKFFSVECYTGYNFAVIRSRTYNTL